MTDTNKLIVRDNQELQLKIDQYADMLFKVSFLRLQNRQDAEDVVQEVFYQYIKKESPFRDEEHEKAWLLTVTLNYCRKVRRSAWSRRRSQDTLEELEEIYRDKAVNPMESDSGKITGRREENPEESAVKAETDRQVFLAVNSLPMKYRDVIHLFYYEELSVRKIAEITGRKESTVTSQLTRGREMLRKSLKEEYDFA